MNIKSILSMFLTLSCVFIEAQTETTIDTNNKKANKKSIEIGIGMDMHNLSRIGFQNYTSTVDGDHYKLKIRNAMFGGNLYFSRELKPWLYFDVQGTLGVVKALDLSDIGKEKNKLFGMIGPGLQFRLTPLFKKKYVEPYFRAGINYYYKEFLVVRQNELKNVEGKPLTWNHSDQFDNTKDQKNSFFPFAFGFGVNSWFNDRVGFGIQGEYLTAFNENSVSFPHVSARVMLRFGDSKESKTIVTTPPEIRYVEKIVIKEVPVEKIVEKITVLPKETVSNALSVLFININFNFNESSLTPESQEIIDQAASILKEMTGNKFLISGFTDRIGSKEYNKTLSEKRAETVRKALINQGVPADMLKSRGIGKDAASMPESETNKVREGDRKVSIEYIQNMEYWNRLP